MEKNMQKHALVLGATASLGDVLCDQLATQGWRLTLAGRDEKQLTLMQQHLQIRYGTSSDILTLNLVDPSFSFTALLNTLPTIPDTVFVLVGDIGDTEQPFNKQNIEQVTRVNYTAIVESIAEIFPKMQENGGGDIVIVSSVAGERGRQSNVIYGSAKAALTSFASGLRNYCTIHKLPIHIMTVLPGFIDTPQTYSLQSRLTASREYVVQSILRGIEKRRNILYVPGFWRFIMLAICAIPEEIFKRLKL